MDGKDHTERMEMKWKLKSFTMSPAFVYFLWLQQPSFLEGQHIVMETTEERLWKPVTSIPKLLNFHYIVFFISAFLALVQLI